jgi:hypothetical protein
LKPIITVYVRGSEDKAKKFEGFMEAAFWMGIDHGDGDLVSVKVRQPAQTYDEEVATLGEFTDLLIKRQINFSIEFFAEPQPMEVLAQVGGAPAAMQDGSPLVLTDGSGSDYQNEMDHLKEEYKKGQMTKKQYKSKKEDLLRRWKDKVEGNLGT